ncbi:MAG TPA: hypothetical protein VGJ35_03545 [Burkholderiaceae bacterium]|jgi:hypothetical protein
MKRTTWALCMLLPAMASAHEGHGLFGPHWHATDTLGFIVAGAVAGALAWWARRK